MTYLRAREPPIAGGDTVTSFASGPRHRASRRTILTTLFAVTAAVAIAIVASIAVSGGTFALWSNTQNVSAGTVSSGTITLTVNSGSTVALSGTTWSTLLPGDSVQQQVTLKNTGNVSATVSGTTTGLFGPLLVHTAKGACAGTLSGTSSTVSPTTIGTFAAGETATACIQVSLPLTAANAAQGTSQSFTLTYSARAGA